MKKSASPIGIQSMLGNALFVKENGLVETVSCYLIESRKNIKLKSQELDWIFYKILYKTYKNLNYYT